MTDAATTDTASGFLQKLAELGATLIDAARPAAKAAAEASIAAVQIRGITSILGAIILIAVGGLAWWGAGKFHQLAIRWKRERQGSVFDDGHIAWHIAAACCGVGGVVVFGFALSALLSAMTWMALFRPDAYLAAKVLGL